MLLRSLGGFRFYLWFLGLSYALKVLDFTDGF